VDAVCDLAFICRLASIASAEVVFTKPQSNDITTILNRMEVFNATDSSQFPVLAASEPPFLVVGTASAPFLAKIALYFVGSGERAEQMTTLEHWTEVKSFSCIVYIPQKLIRSFFSSMFYPEQTQLMVKNRSWTSTWTRLPSYSQRKKAMNLTTPVFTGDCTRTAAKSPKNLSEDIAIC